MHKTIVKFQMALRCYVVGEKAVLRLNSTQLSSVKTQSGTKNWRTVNRATNPLIPELDAVHTVNHVVNTTP